MAQFLRPNANVTQTSFTNGFGEIDETSASDSDFAWSANNVAATLEVALTNPAATPGAGTTTIRYRIARMNNGVLDGGGNACLVTAALYQGTTLISADSQRNSDGTWTTYSWAPDVSSVTDWNDLRLRFTTTASGGGPSVRRGAAISWAEVEAPDAAASNPATSTLTDNFGAALDSGKWTASNNNGTAATSGGVLDLNVSSTTPVSHATILSVDDYDLTGDVVFARLVRPATNAGGADVALTSLRVLDSVDTSDYFEFFISTNGALMARMSTNGTVSDQFIASYSATTHAWLRLGEAAGTIYWDTADNTASDPPTSGQWTNRRSNATPPSTFTSCKVRLRVEYWSATVDAINQSAQFDGLNTGTSSGTSAALTGQAATSARGTPGVSLDKTLAGQAAAAARGTATAAVSTTPTGQAASTARGSAGVERSLTPTGQAASAARGTAVPATSLPLAGQAASTAAGTVSASAGFETALTGLGATTARGTAIPTTDKALTGQAAGTARGALTGGTEKPLTGLSASSAQGGVTPSTAGSIELTGLQASAARGTAVAATDKALTGQAAGTAAGGVNPTLDTSVELTGLQASAARGTAVAATDKALTGLAASTARGAVGATISLPLIGRSVDSAPGSVLSISPEAATLGSGTAFGSTAFGTVPFGGGSDAAVVVLTGHGMTVGRGVINRQFAPVALTGHGMATARGGVSPAITPPGPLATLIGHRTDAGVGRLGVVITTTPAGVQLVLQDGQIRPRQLSDAPSLRSAVVPIDLTSVDVPFDTGVIVQVDANIALVPASPERAESN